MKYATLIAATALAAVLNGPVSADQASQGIIDALRTQSKAAARAEREGASLAVSRTSSVIVEFRITIKSAIEAAAKPVCSVGLYHYTGTGYFSENISVVATRTGETASCRVTVPFSWKTADTSEPVSVTTSVNWSASAANAAAGKVTERSAIKSVEIALPEQGKAKGLTQDFTF